MTEDNQMQAAPAVLRATIQIKRAATGKVETYEVTGTPLPPDEPPPQEPAK